MRGPAFCGQERVRRDDDVLGLGEDDVEVAVEHRGPLAGPGDPEGGDGRRHGRHDGDGPAGDVAGRAVTPTAVSSSTGGEDVAATPLRAGAADVLRRPDDREGSDGDGDDEPTAGPIVGGEEPEHGDRRGGEQPGDEAVAVGDPHRQDGGAGDARRRAAIRALPRRSATTPTTMAATRQAAQRHGPPRARRRRGRARSARPPAHRDVDVAEGGVGSRARPVGAVLGVHGALQQPAGERQHARTATAPVAAEQRRSRRSPRRRSTWRHTTAKATAPYTRLSVRIENGQRRRPRPPAARRHGPRTAEHGADEGDHAPGDERHADRVLPEVEGVDGDRRRQADDPEREHPVVGRRRAAAARRRAAIAASTEPSIGSSRASRSPPRSYSGRAEQQHRHGGDLDPLAPVVAAERVERMGLALRVAARRPSTARPANHDPGLGHHRRGWRPSPRCRCRGSRAHRAATTSPRRRRAGTDRRDAQAERTRPPPLARDHRGPKLRRPRSLRPRSGARA